MGLLGARGIVKEMFQLAGLENRNVQLRVGLNEGIRITAPLELGRQSTGRLTLSLRTDPHPIPDLTADARLLGKGRETAAAQFFLMTDRIRGRGQTRNLCIPPGHLIAW